MRYSPPPLSHRISHRCPLRLISRYSPRYNAAQSVETKVCVHTLSTMLFAMHIRYLRCIPFHFPQTCTYGARENSILVGHRMLESTWSDRLSRYSPHPFSQDSVCGRHFAWINWITLNFVVKVEDHQGCKTLVETMKSQGKLLCRNFQVNLSRGLLSVKTCYSPEFLQKQFAPHSWPPWLTEPCGVDCNQICSIHPTTKWWVGDHFDTIRSDLPSLVVLSILSQRNFR